MTNNFYGVYYILRKKKVLGLICLIITILTLFTLILAVIFKPVMRIKIKNIEISFQTFWVVSLIGMILLLIFNQISQNNIYALFDFKSTVNPFKILILFVSISTLSIVLEIAGFFELCANFVLEKVNNSQKKLFIYLYLLVSFLTIFTSNDIIILTFTRFICYFAKKKNINPLPYLVGEFVSANTLSLIFIIGNPTNIYLATFYNISFFEYFKVMFLPTLILSLVGFCVVFIIFKKELDKPISNNEISQKLEHNNFLIIIGLIHLLLCTGSLIISSYLNFEMWYICLGFALSITIIVIIYDGINKQKNELKIVKQIPWNLIPFLLSMFLIVMSLNEHQYLIVISDKLHSLSVNKFVETFVYGLSSMLSCSLVNNIPMSVAYASIIEHQYSINELYATIMGSNIGAIFSPMGALAGIMWIKYLKEKQIDYSFLTFVKNGILICVPVMFTGLLILYLVLI